MTVGTDFRQRAYKIPFRVIAVVVVDMDEEVRGGRALGRHGRTGQLGYLIGLRDCGEMEDAGHAGCHHQCKADQQPNMPFSFFHLTQFHRDLGFFPVVLSSPPLCLFTDLMITGSLSINALI